ncbi:MAG: hypothetical protein ACLTNO_10145 [Blautia sp.]
MAPSRPDQDRAPCRSDRNAKYNQLLHPRLSGCSLKSLRMEKDCQEW